MEEDLLTHCDRQGRESGIQPIQKAIPLFLEVLEMITSILEVQPTILEVGAGNGWNTMNLQIASGLDWPATDIQNHEPSYYLIDIISAKEAISKFPWNTLLMVSPTPNVPWSLDAIKHAMTVNDHFFLIFFGEMGYSDGSPGTDRFLDNPVNGFNKLFMKPYKDITFELPRPMSYVEEDMFHMLQKFMMIGSSETPNIKFVYLYEFRKKP